MALAYLYNMNNIFLQDFGNVEYDKAWALQEKYMQEGLDIKSERFNNPHDVQEQKIRNFLFLCEHPHVYTLGKSGAIEHLLINNQIMKDLGVSFHKTNRGGDITYHGPGQLVAYPVLDLEQFYTDLGRYMRSLEETVILTLKEYDIQSGRLPGSTGVWLDPEVTGKARKICAMGVRSSRWITMHGLALNINTDLTFFNHIVPCGISDKGVTSMQKELGQTVNEEEVKSTFIANFSKVFDVTLSQLS